MKNENENEVDLTAVILSIVLVVSAALAGITIYVACAYPAFIGKVIACEIFCIVVSMFVSPFVGPRYPR